jgi:hypothetical protein
LFYIYAESRRWPDGRPISPSDLEIHRAEIARFAGLVCGDEVAFRSCPYRDLLSEWAMAPGLDIRAHAASITTHFSP